MAAMMLDVILILTSLWVIGGNAHNIQMKAHTRECFHEMLHKDDKMTVTFQVGDREFGGGAEIWISTSGYDPPALSHAAVCAKAHATLRRREDSTV